MTTMTSSATLRKDQARAYDALATELAALDRTPTRYRPSQLRKIDACGVDLAQHCRRLESILTAEDERLRTEGTTDELDDRWIKNLRRLELMLALLAEAKAAVPGMQVAA
jgi:hypothetical protein